MNRFLLVLGVFFIVFPAFAQTEDEKEASVVSVRMFNDICIPFFINPEGAAELLSKAPVLPEEQSKIFRDVVKASAESVVHAYNFPKANFVFVTDQEQGACHMLGDRQLDFALVQSEFDKAVAAVNETDMMTARVDNVLDEERMRAVMLEYEPVNVNAVFRIFASVNKTKKDESQIGSIYTATVHPKEPVEE